MAGLELMCDKLWTRHCPGFVNAPPIFATLGLYSVKLFATTRGSERVEKCEHVVQNICKHCLGLATSRSHPRSVSCCWTEGMEAASHKRTRASARNSETHSQDSNSSTSKLVGRVVAFTTPAEYAHRLEEVLTSAGASPLWYATIAVESTPATQLDVVASLWGSSLSDPSQNQQTSRSSSIEGVRGIAFTSRAGIRAFAQALAGRPSPLSAAGELFILAALGKDMDLLQDLNLFPGNPRITYLTPPLASPASLVDSLGPGRNQRLLCPVPLVRDLQEPHVVPSFLQALSAAGWQPVRVNAYVTRWMGALSTNPLLTQDLPHPRLACDALIFTSTAEVEGLLKSLQMPAQELNSLAKGRCVVAAHGPVTAEGAARLGVQVDVVGSKFHSFAGIVGALTHYFDGLPHCFDASSA